MRVVSSIHPFTLDIRCSLTLFTDFYKKTELPLRMAYFWASSLICNIFAAFLAFGVLHMRGVQGKEGWRYAHTYI